MEFFSRIVYGLAIVIFISCNAESKPTSNIYEALTVNNCGRSLVLPNYPDRIVGGTYALHGQYPWMVSLRERGDHGFEHVCGATILNKNWIVTAAHCIEYESTRMYEILVGLHKLSEEHAYTARRYKISRIVLHEKFDSENLKNDIALLKTVQPIDIAGSGGYINGVCLPKNKNDPTGYATVIGWGHTKEDGENSDTLKQVRVPVISRRICNEMYDEDPDDNVDEILDTNICAGITGRDSCQNDSGGPLMQTDKSGVTTLIGVVSHGAGCGEKFYPGVYTKVSMYQDWMTSIIEK